MKKVFLLGGHDLEMITIKEILKDKEDVIVIDKDLKWGAKLSEYKENLKKHSNEKEYEIYGVELIEDCETPHNYHRIDHHNDLYENPSSLEQVAKLLEIKLTTNQELIAANDRGGILEMCNVKLDKDADKESEASWEMIKKIREQDRKACGITEEDEQKADEALAQNLTIIKGLAVIESLTDHFAAISDKYFFKENSNPLKECKLLNYIIYKGKDLCFYGNPSVVSALAALYRKDIVENNAYRGRGFFGFCNWDGEKHLFDIIADMVNQYSTIDKVGENQSYHIFFYPFRWKSLVKNTEAERHTIEDDTNLELVKLNPETTLWTNGTDSSGSHSFDNITLYNEKNYFYNFCHRLLYDEGKTKDGIVKHFERRKKTASEEWKYTIRIKNKVKGIWTIKDYCLTIDAINLNFYDTGIGILSFYLINKENTEPDDILKINQYGRRVFPPFFTDIAERKETPLSLCLNLGKDNDKDILYEETFDDYSTIDVNKPASFLEKLITEAIGESVKIYPTDANGNKSTGIDDRMFVLCWYYNQNLVKRFHPDCKKEEGTWDNVDNYDELETDALNSFLSSSDFWYQYVFVDGSWETCQNPEMKAELLDKATYKRWSKFGSLYGISRYSMVMLSNGYGSEEHLYRTMVTIYARLAETVLLQKASMLRFSSEISDICSDRSASLTLKALYKKADALNKSYIKYVNLMQHLEVTAQDQGIEMYDMLQSQLRIKDMQEALSNEISTLHDYISLQKDRSYNNDILLYTVGAAIIAVAALIGQFIGIKWNEVPDCQKILTILIPPAIMGFLGYLFIWKSNNNK